MTIHYRKSSNYYLNLCGSNSDEWRTTHTNVSCTGCLEKLITQRRAELSIIQTKLDNIVRRPHQPRANATDVANAGTTESPREHVGIDVLIGAY